jgi:hypothetical protein
MPKLIDRSEPKSDDLRIRVEEYSADGLTFVPEVRIPAGDLLRVRKLFGEYKMPRAFRCQGQYLDANNTGFTSEQLREKDIPQLLFAVYENRNLIGGLNLFRIKILKQLPGEIQASSALTPAFPDQGTDAWMSRVFGIMEYILDNNLSTEIPGTVLNITRWEVPEGGNATMKEIKDAGSEVNNFLYADRNLRIVEGDETFLDGRKINYLERIPIVAPL